MYSQFFSFCALLALAISVMVYPRLSQTFNKLVPLSLIGASVLALLASLLPKLPHDTQAQTNQVSAASHNPNLSPQHILQLIDYPNCEVRRALIGDPNISETVLTQIIEHDPDVGVRHDAKRRLDFLHGISHLDVDKRSAMNTNNKIVGPAGKVADPLQLEAIYKNLDIEDDPDEVLAGLAENCHISQDMARAIYAKAASKKGYARTAALIALATNSQTPKDVLNELVNEKELAILRALASNPHISYEIIDHFAPYPDCKIRKEIICLPSASTAVLKKLRNDADESVAKEASERLRTQSSYLDICKESQKTTPSCDGSETPEMRVYPNTSENTNPQNVSL